MTNSHCLRISAEQLNGQCQLYEQDHYQRLCFAHLHEQHLQAAVPKLV